MDNDTISGQVRSFMNRLEQEVIIPRLRSGLYNQKLRAAIKTQRLHNTPFGMLVGEEFECPDFFVIDYYGLIKKSSGLMDKVRKLQEEGFSIRSVEVPVVYFSSVIDEHIKQWSPDLIHYFSKFKSILVDLRDFPPMKKK